MEGGEREIFKPYGLDKAIAPSEAWDDEAVRHQVICPVCGNKFSHTRFADDAGKDDPNSSRWQWLTVVNFWGECDHVWEICFGDHNGQVYVFSRVVTDA